VQFSNDMNKTTEEKITNFLPVFKQRLDYAHDELKKELNKPKKERNKKALKIFLSEIKEMRDVVGDLEKELNTCPKCGYVMT
jgi:hypothetical protein